MACNTSVATAENWLQLQGDSRRSGDSIAELPSTLGLVGSVPLSDSVFASPVVANDVVYVVDGSGVVWALDAKTLSVHWKYITEGGAGNCNNVSSPAILGNYLHVGTMAGYYYVLDIRNGSLVRKIDCGEAIFSSPVAGKDRVYFATIGAHVYAVEPDGRQAWTWDFVKQVIGFEG